MPDRELAIPSDGARLPAALSVPPAGPIRGGLVPLHPASDPSRGQFLFRHLAEVLPPLGVAVLRFDRRPGPDDGDDVPLATQAQDALAAFRALRAAGVGEAPVGLWGFSQGAWAAPLAAADSTEVAFLVLVASTGVSPAAQMRHATSEQIRRGGFGERALLEVAELRAAFEAHLRGQAEPAVAQAVVDRLASRPWFPLAWVPQRLPPSDSWRDMDFDPVPVFARVRCPVLLFYGEDDAWTPVAASMAAWRRAAAAAQNADVTIVRLPRMGHHPTLHDRQDSASIGPLYTEQLLTWLGDRLGAADAPRGGCIQSIQGREPPAGGVSQ